MSIAAIRHLPTYLVALYGRSYYQATSSPGLRGRGVLRGVYRFRDYPSSPREYVAAAWLAVGKDTAVVSHESALDPWDLSDAVPDAVHLTVPRARRSLARSPPPGVDDHTTARPCSGADVRSLADRIKPPVLALRDDAKEAPRSAGGEDLEN